MAEKISVDIKPIVMMIIHYEIHPQNPQTRLVDKAVEALEDGKIVIYPTDTVYGLGCSIYKRHAIETLYRLKGREKWESMSILCGSIQQAAKFVKISNFAFRVVKRCLPGPFTVILEATREIPKLMLSRKKEIGFRIPNHPLCQMLIEKLGHPILNTSATVSENGYLDEPFDIAETYKNEASLILDSGILYEAEQSTVIRIVNDEIEILREGKGDIKKLFI